MIFEECLKKGKWPIHNDERPYHTIRYKGHVIRGNRNMKGRFDWLGIPKDMTGMKVLDMGCNAGEVSKECHDRGAEVVGFDCDRRVLELAREVHPGPTYKLANMNLFPKGFDWILQQDFDLILCLSIVNHVDKKRLKAFFGMLNWKEMVFEGHQIKFCHEKDLPTLLKGYKIRFKGMSDERLSRPLWTVKSY